MNPWDNYKWYRLFNLAEWVAEGRVQRLLTIDLEDMGRHQFLINQGNTTSVLWEDRFLPVNFLDQNPYEQDGVAIYRGQDDEVYIGFQEAE